MAIQNVINITADLNTGSIWQGDIGGWDYAVVQLVTPTGTFTFNTTNDAGAVQDVSDGSAISATNWIACQGTNLNSGSGVTTLAASGLVRFQSVGQFLQIIGAGAATVTKAFVRLYKIN